MPFALLAIAAIFIVTGFRGTTSQFLSTFTADVKGFFPWIVSIIVIGAIGYIPGLKKFSDGFLILVLLVLFISNKGFFSQFNSQLSQAGTAPATSPSTNVADGLNGLNPSMLPDLNNPSLGSIPSLNPGISPLDPGSYEQNSFGGLQGFSSDESGILGGDTNSSNFNEFGGITSVPSLQ